MSPARDEPRVFALSETGELGREVADALGTALSRHEERAFEDGEYKIRPLESVRGHDVFVLQSLYADARLSVHDKLCRLLFFVGALKDASARRVRVLMPYLCYARKDRRSKSRDPVTTRYVAQLLEAAGADHVATLEVHNIAAFQNAFRCPSDHLDANRLFAQYFAGRLQGEGVVVVSPDAGGMKRAERLRRFLARPLGEEPGMAFLEKYRSGGTVSGEAVVGQVRGRAAIIVDDLVSTGGTLLRAARACKAGGATRVFAAATHGLFVGPAPGALADPALDRLVVTDTVPPFRLEGSPALSKLDVLATAPLFAAAIRRMHDGGSVSELLGEDDAPQLR